MKKTVKGKPFKMQVYYSRAIEGLDYLREGDIAIVSKKNGGVSTISFFRSGESISGYDELVSYKRTREISFFTKELVAITATFEFFGVRFKELERHDNVTKFELAHFK